MAPNLLQTARTASHIQRVGYRAYRLSAVLVSVTHRNAGSAGRHAAQYRYLRRRGTGLLQDAAAFLPEPKRRLDDWF